MDKIRIPLMPFVCHNDAFGWVSLGCVVRSRNPRDNLGDSSWVLKGVSNCIGASRVTKGVPFVNLDYLCKLQNRNAFGKHKIHQLNNINFSLFENR